MKSISFLVLLFFSCPLLAQHFDFYGPQPFDQILNNTFENSWTPTVISSIENREFVLILDAATKSSAISISESNYTELSVITTANITETYGSVLRSVFQIVDINTHLDNTEISLNGVYKINPILHSYFGLNIDTNNKALLTDGGTRYIENEENSGFVTIEFDGTPESSTIKMTGIWSYSVGLDSVIEISNTDEKWLKIEGSSVGWTETEGEASSFYLANANNLIDLKIEEGSAFNPLNVTYQPNATAVIPEVSTMDQSPILTSLQMDIDNSYLSQFGNSEDANLASSEMLDAIETRLISTGASLRYPKEFYLAARENMLSHKVASSDIYNSILGYNTIAHVYFTNATDDEGVPHPFMVIAAHATSTRPNLLLDVNRPPGAQQGVQYGQSTVTRHGKLGEFLVKIPLKDYGLIDNLLENDLSPFGDLASAFDADKGTTTEKTVYNYVGLASVGMAVDGVTIYPAQNNNIRFAVEDGEVTHSGIHVGGGLELHYHADGHAYSGNGINLYNLSDYENRNHPPVIGFAYDGLALFGKYETSYNSMAGFDITLDEFGGHDHEDGFGYHYHSHTQSVSGSDQFETEFDEHFLLVGAWRGNINSIPGFDEGKLNQLKDQEIARYAGAPYTEILSSEVDSELATVIKLNQNFPNPFNPSTSISFELPSAGNVELSVFDLLGRNVALLINNEVKTSGTHSVTFDATTLSSGLYVYQLKVDNRIVTRTMSLIK